MNKIPKNFNTNNPNNKQTKKFTFPPISHFNKKTIIVKNSSLDGFGQIYEIR